MTKWTEDDVATLKVLAKDGLSTVEAAVILKRTPAAVSGKASKEGITFDSIRFSEVRSLLANGGAVAREDHGGVVGIRWCSATRSGGSFDVAFCEHLLSRGLIVPDPHARGEVYRRAQ